MDNQFKLNSSDEGNTYELYDLINDPGEREDVSTAYPDKVSNLSAQLKSWLLSCQESTGGRDYVK